MTAERYPRVNTYQQRRGDRLLAAVGAVSDDKEFASLRFVAAVMLSYPGWPPADIERVVAKMTSRFAMLAPAAAAEIGEYLPAWMRQFAFGEAARGQGMDIDSIQRSLREVDPWLRTERLVPHGRIRASGAGAVVPLDMDDDDEEVLSLRDYKRSLRPEGKPGRPARIETSTPQRPRAPLSAKDSVAVRAALLDESGAGPDEIGARIGLSYDRYNKAARDAALKTVHRRIERGYNLIDAGYGAADAD